MHNCFAPSFDLEEANPASRGSNVCMFSLMYHPLFSPTDWFVVLASIPLHIGGGLLCLAISVIMDVLLQNRSVL